MCSITMVVSEEGRPCRSENNLLRIDRRSLNCGRPLIRLHSVLRTYRETFCDSIDVSKTFRLRCDLRYKPHFVLFSCDFLTTGLTRWSRVRNYQSNNYVSQKLDSTNSSASITCVQELHTFATLRLFPTFACSYDFDQTIHRKLVPDITNLGSVT